MELVNILFDSLSSLILSVLTIFVFFIGLFLVLSIIAIIKVFIDIMKGKLKDEEDD